MKRTDRLLEDIQMHLERDGRLALDSEGTGLPRRNVDGAGGQKGTTGSLGHLFNDLEEKWPKSRTQEGYLIKKRNQEKT